MTCTRGCGELRRELGVYVLGALEPADRSSLDDHLASCANCRNQLADLAGLPALLSRVSLDEVESPVLAGGAGGASGTGPDRPLESLLRQAARRRKYRVGSTLAAAAAAMAAGVAATIAAAGSPAHRPASVALPGEITVSASNPGDDTSAVVTYAGRPWGVQLDVQVHGVATGTTCVLEVSDSSGRESQAGSFTVAVGDDDAWYMATSSVPITRVRAFIVRAGAQALVRVNVPAALIQIDGPK